MTHNMEHREFNNPQVEKVFNSYPQEIKSKLLGLRELIYQLAEESDDIGVIEETLKWENPSYITQSPKSGTTVRLVKVRASNTEYAISVHCQTSLISEFKQIYPELKYDGNRSIVFNVTEQLPLETISHFVYLALTYHYRKKQAVSNV